MKYFVDGGPAQQVTQFQPTFSQQGIGSLQQAPNIPAMEGSPTDYSAAPTQQYTPTTSYSAPAAMTAGLGSYMEGLQYKAPAPSTATTGTTSTTGTTTYNPKTQTYTGAGTSTTAPTTTPSSSTTYNPDTQTYTAPTPTAPTAPTTSVNPSVNYDPQNGYFDSAGRLMMVGDDGQFYYPAPDTGGELAAGGRIHSYAQGGSIPQGIASLGRGQDSMLVHMTPGEVQGLQRLAMAHGGSLTINPQTGLPEAGFLSSLLPTLIGAGLMMVPGMQPLGAAAITGGLGALATGSLGKGLMYGLGAYGGASLGGSLAGMGAEQAKQLAANEAAINGANIAQKGLISSGNDAADLAFRQTVADKATANQAYQASLNDRALGIDATYNPPAAQYSAQDFMAGKAPKDFGTFTQPSMPEAPQFSQTPEEVRDAVLEHAKLDRGQFGAYLPSTPVTPQTYSPATQAALDRGPVGNAFEGFKQLGSKEGIKNLGGKLGYAGVAGLAAPLLSSALTPAPFNPPANKPTQYVRYGDGRTPGYTPPKYNPITGNYDPAFYGPESFYNSAQGGAVGYRQGGIADFYPLTGDRPNTGGLGGAAEKPRYSREINDPDSGAGINNDKAGEGPYSDSGGVYENTPSKKRFKKTSADKLALYLNSNDPTDIAEALAETRRRANAPKSYRAVSAAQGGLMGTYAAGGKLLRGPGDGMSDSIPAVIQGANPQRAALADGEFVIPADVVSHFGNGSTPAGAEHLYSVMDKIRKARTGNPKQGKQINPDRFMSA
jgi:hypothetical protein